MLTGTPLENKLEELYSIVQFVDERRFGPAFQFLHDHRVLDENYNLKGYRNLEKIREKLAAVFLRRTRGEVLTRKRRRGPTTPSSSGSTPNSAAPTRTSAPAAPLLQKNFLTDLDRKRILSSMVNMRMVCDSLFLLDKQSRVPQARRVRRTRRGHHHRGPQGCRLLAMGDDDPRGREGAELRSVSAMPSCTGAGG